MLPGQRCRLVAEVKSNFRDPVTKQFIRYGVAGEVVEIVRDEAHNCMVTVELSSGVRFATKRTNLLPLPSKPLF